MRDIKVKLLEDLANKGKGSVFMMKGNKAAKLKHKGVLEFAKESDELVIYPSKELKDFLAKKKAKK